VKSHSEHQRTGPRLFLVTTVGDTHWHFLQGQVPYLQSQGFEVTLVASPGKMLDACARRDRVRCIPLQMTRSITPLTDLIALLQLWWVLRCERPDIVQFSTPKAGLLASIAAACAGIRCRIFLARGSIASAHRGMSVCLNRWAEWVTVRLSTQVVCVSSSLRAELQKQRILPREAGVVIESGMSNGVDTTYFQRPVSKGKKSAAKPTVGFVGRLNREKGIEEFAAAWEAIRAAVPEAKALILGEWDVVATVNAEVRRSLERDPAIQLVGHVDDIRPWLEQMQVLCFPSHREGFPNVPMEAAAMEVPVVAFDAIGSRDAVVDGKTGVLVPLHDHEALAAATIRYLKQPEVARAHGVAGRERVCSCFQPHSIWHGLCKVYQNAHRQATRNNSWYRLLWKPVFDRGVAFVALVALSPVFGLLWILVRRRLGSPVLFSQIRPGKKGRPFRLFKFRTMTDQRDSTGNLLPDRQRITPFGQWLRSTSLDELPELFNILIGDMSFVGPRPLLMEYLPRYSESQRKRHDVLPGLTGLAQVKGRNQIGWQRKFKYDVFYTQNIRFLFDLKILWMTLRTVLRREGIVDQSGVSAAPFNPTNNVVVIGAGGHAKVVISCLRASGMRPTAIYDDNEQLWGTSVAGVAVAGGIAELEKGSAKVKAIIAIGDNETRQAVREKLADALLKWTTVIHPAAIVDQTASIGEGTLICAGAVIQADASIGEHVIINTGAHVDHDSSVGDYSHVGPSGTLTGNCVVETTVLVGAGGIVIPGCRIKKGVTVAAGATVTGDVAEGITVSGCPAKERRKTAAVVVPTESWPVFDAEQIEAVTAVLQSGKVNYWTGCEGKSFETEFAEFIGVRHGVAVANGTVALEAALMAIGIGPGDEVIVPSRTFIATASAVVMRGATPVIADIDVASQNLTVQTIREVITPRTRAVIAVHLGGWPCEMEEIIAFAGEHKLFVIEDCAQAHGARINGRHVGSFGDISAFSFCQDKIITTLGEGGMVVTNNSELWAKVWSYKDHGKDWELANSQGKPGEYRFLHKTFGTNWRMTEAQAAVGRIQLKRLPEWHATRVSNATYLRQLLLDCPGLSLPDCRDGLEHAFYRLYAYVDPAVLRPSWTRDKIIAAIQSEGGVVGVGSCGEIYREQAFRNRYDESSLPGASRGHDTSLAFLVHPGISSQTLETLARTIQSVMSRATSGVRRILQLAG